MRCIDADALIHELNNSHYPGAPYVDAGISIAIGKVCDAPTIEPERKIGTWEPVDEIPSIRKRFRRYCCSNCKKEGFDTWNFCPVCGQRNREGEQE